MVFRKELQGLLLKDIQSYERPPFNYNPKFDGFTQDEIDGHLQLLLEDGFITGKDHSSKNGFAIGEPCLRTKGHQSI